MRKDKSTAALTSGMLPFRYALIDCEPEAGKQVNQRTSKVKNEGGSIWSRL
jgi:hypothetical protein